MDVAVAVISPASLAPVGETELNASAQFVADYSIPDGLIVASHRIGDHRQVQDVVGSH